MKFSEQTLLMPREPIRAPLGVNVPSSAMAGFQLTLYGRIWVTPEAQARWNTDPGNNRSTPNIQVMPYSTRRIEGLLFGNDQQKTDSVVLLELKQWSSESVEDCPSRM